MAQDTTIAVLGVALYLYHIATMNVLMYEGTSKFATTDFTTYAARKNAYDQLLPVVDENHRRSYARKCLEASRGIFADISKGNIRPSSETIADIRLDVIVQEIGCPDHYGYMLRKLKCMASSTKQNLLSLARELLGAPKQSTVFEKIFNCIGVLDTITTGTVSETTTRTNAPMIPDTGSDWSLLGGTGMHAGAGDGLADYSSPQQGQNMQLDSILLDLSKQMVEEESRTNVETGLVAVAGSEQHEGMEHRGMDAQEPSNGGSSESKSPVHMSKKPAKRGNLLLGEEYPTVTALDEPGTTEPSEAPSAVAPSGKGGAKNPSLTTSAKASVKKVHAKMLQDM
jgi:hypothetical protein